MDMSLKSSARPGKFSRPQAIYRAPNGAIVSTIHCQGGAHAALQELPDQRAANTLGRPKGGRMAMRISRYQYSEGPTAPTVYKFNFFHAESQVNRSEEHTSELQSLRHIV